MQKYEKKTEHKKKTAAPYSVNTWRTPPIINVEHELHQSNELIFVPFVLFVFFKNE